MDMVISISNHKGGTGKTTTAINIASAFTKKGKRVLLIDLDPQGNLSYSLGIAGKDVNGMASVLLQESGLNEAIVPYSEFLEVVPWDVNLYKAEDGIKNIAANCNYRNLALQLDGVKDKFDFVLVDCPPSFSVFTKLSLTASDYILVPVLLDVLSIQGLSQVLNNVAYIKEHYNPNLEVSGVLAVNVDERRQLTFQVLEFIKEGFNVNIFNSYVRSNVRAAEAPSFAKSVIDYAPGSNSASDYLAVAGELLDVINNKKSVLEVV